MAESTDSTPRSTFLDLVEGRWIKADESTAAEAKKALVAQTAFNRVDPSDADALAAARKAVVPHAHPDVTIRPPMHVDFGTNISIGRGTFINYGLVALDCAPISIGEDCKLATNVQLLTPQHPLAPGPRKEGWERALPIVLERNVWLGGGVIVLAGVTIGANSVIGAGSVVTKDIPPNVVAVGNPARVIKQLDPEDDTLPPHPTAVD